MPQLDSIRAFAVGLVFIAHWVNSLEPAGQSGVRLFFALSGFLITSILLKLRNEIEIDNTPWHKQLILFYARRFLRLFPALVLLIGILISLNWGSIRVTWPWHVSYLSNVYFAVRGEFEGPISPLWSLSVEEQFYMFWPLVILAAPRRFHLPGAVAFVFAAVVWRFGVWWVGTNALWTSVLPFPWLDGIGCGALLSLLSARTKGSLTLERFLSIAWKIGIPVFLGLLVLRSVGMARPFTVVFLQLAESLAFAWLVMRAAIGFKGRVGRFFEWLPLIYLGRISYGLYLYHAFIPGAFKYEAGRLGIALTAWGVPAVVYDIAGVIAPGFAAKLAAVIMIVIYTSLTVGVATISWFAWEHPINGLRRYVRYRGLKPSSDLSFETSKGSGSMEVS